jgi:hypothetical protein
MREGNLVAIPMCKNEFQLAKELEADLANRLPILMCIQDHVDYKDRKKISEDLMNFYLKGEKIDEHTVGENFQEVSSIVATLVSLVPSVLWALDRGFDSRPGRFYPEGISFVLGTAGFLLSYLSSISGR